MLGSSLNFFVPLAAFKVMSRCEMVRPYPPKGFSASSGVSSVTSPSYTSFVSRTRSPATTLVSDSSLNKDEIKRLTNSPPEALHQNLRLLHFLAVHFASHHHRKRSPTPNLQTYTQRKSRLARPRPTGK